MAKSDDNDKNRPGFKTKITANGKIAGRPRDNLPSPYRASADKTTTREIVINDRIRTRPLGITNLSVDRAKEKAMEREPGNKAPEILDKDVKSAKRRAHRIKEKFDK